MFASEIGGIPVPNQQEGEGKKFDMMFSYLAAKGELSFQWRILMAQF